MGTLIYQSPQSATCFDHVDLDYHYSMADNKKGKEGPAFFKGEFSFVNKDARNIDSKDHNAAVSWHVMNRCMSTPFVWDAHKMATGGSCHCRTF